MGLVVSGVWLHIIAPDQNALFIVLCGLVTQGSGIWRWRTILPFILGGAAGVAAGTALQRSTRPSCDSASACCWCSTAPTASPGRRSRRARAALPPMWESGMANGLIGGLTGLGGIAVAIWGQIRVGSKNAQRAVFQPVMFATFLMSAISLGFVDACTAGTMKLYALALIAGIGCGFWLYGRIDDAAFRRMILVLLLASGLSLVVPAAFRSAHALLSRAEDLPRGDQGITHDMSNRYSVTCRYVRPG